VAENFTTEEFQKKMARIDDCIDCGHCREHCPYELDTPNLLKREYAFYKEFIKNNGPK
jgi:predicted aldo/keto reductase-like oxidoreductase